MVTPNDGGKAFPSSSTDKISRDWTGMTLRDYYAGQALASLAGKTHLFRTVFMGRESIARDCYAYADALIEERRKDG